MIFQFTASQGGWRPVPIVLHRDWIHFNSQPHKEADYNAVQMLRQVEHFNSQPHKEADWPHGRYTTDSQSISIHSLTRRLTKQRLTTVRTSRHFNSQPHKEADEKWRPNKKYEKDISIHSLTRRLTLKGLQDRLMIDFNSQPHKEADPANNARTGYHYYFNSQPHKEADKIWTRHSRHDRISIHSLTRRLT